MRIILMSMRVTEANDYKEKRNSIAYDYISFFEKLGFTVILLPNNTNDLKSYLDLFEYSLIVLSGGNSVHPQSYSSSDVVEDTYIERDNIEIELLKYSIKRNIPTVGICKGFHLINCFFNGKLNTEIENHIAIKHMLISGELNFLNGEKSNSFHSQGIKKIDLAEELQTLAITKDNHVECFKHRNYSILGIQWHPERQNMNYDKKLINSLIDGEL